MSIRLASKLISGGLALAATVTGGVALNSHLSPKTIGEKFSNEKFRLLPSGSGQWDTVLQKYKSATDEEKNGIPRKIQYLSSINDKQQFQKECQWLWSTKLNEKNSEHKRIKEDLENRCIEESKALGQR